MKQLLIAFILLITTSSITAQNEWPKQGAQWEICFRSNSWGEPTNYVYNSVVSYSRDTLVDDIYYQISEQLYHNGDKGVQFITRFENDTVFRLINENEYLFFTYNASVGDTLFMQRTGIEDYDQDTCSFSLELKCTEIVEVDIDGEDYTCWEFKDVGDSYYGTNYEGEDSSGGHGLPLYWLERVGWIDWFPWATQPDEGFCNGSQISIGPWQFPSQYTDNEISINIPHIVHGITCDTTLQTTTIQNNKLSIYPNPSTSEITISGLPQDNYTFQVSDNLGRVVLKGELTNEKIDISNLKSGVYMLKIARENQLFYTSKIIKE